MSKTNLIIDGNNIFYQSLFVTNGGKTNGVLLESLEDQEMLIRKVATDLAFTIRHFGNISRIIFTIDSPSWRKDIEIEENDGYKSTREKSKTVNWDAFFNCMNEFAKILENQGIIVSRMRGAEGDDLMYLWQNKLRGLGENSIIVTSDKDMLQMASIKDDIFTVIYRPNSKNRKIVVPMGFTKWLTDEEVIDIFNTRSFMGRSKDIITQAMEKIPVEELDIDNNIIEKVFTGDGGDAVPTVYSWETKSKSGNIVINRITPRRVEKILECVGVDNLTVLKLPLYIKEITSAIRTIAKDKSISEDYIFKKLNRNIKLVVLDSSIIPTEIQDAFEDEFKQAIELPTIATKQFSMNTILEGTRFVKAAETFQSDIFSGINSYSKQKKNLF